MFEYIRGKLVAASPLHAIVDVNGVGYKLLIPASHFAKLPLIGAEVTLYTAYIIRELSHTLCGFLSLREREFFELLNTVSGIGPKTALGLIGNLPAEQLQSAIQSANITTLCKVPGVGKKTAERLVVDLRDKLSSFFHAKTDLLPGLPALPVTGDAMSALVNLGYNQAVAQKAVEKALKETGEEPNLALLITTALRVI
jgi:Holliday junction DNA helicase RuvA